MASAQSYHKVNERLNHTAAQRYCQTQFGTDLASIHSVEDQEAADVLCSSFESRSLSLHCWIGLTDLGAEATFRWTDETSFDFGTTFGEFPWDDGTCMTSGEPQPNNQAGDDHCITIGHDNVVGCNTTFRWTDQNCDVTKRFLCNIHTKAPTPSTTETAGTSKIWTSSDVFTTTESVEVDFIETSNANNLLLTVSVTLISICCICTCFAGVLISLCLKRNKMRRHAKQSIAELAHNSAAELVESASSPQQTVEAVAEIVMLPSDSKDEQQSVAEPNDLIDGESRQRQLSATHSRQLSDMYQVQPMCDRHDQTAGTTTGGNIDTDADIAGQEQEHEQMTAVGKEGEKSDEYDWIENTLHKCDEEDYQQYLANFKFHKMTDEALQEIKDEMDDELWKELIPTAAVRLRFRKYLRESTGTTRDESV